VPTGDTFILNTSGQSAPGIQNEWRWCKNCGVLAYSGGNASAGVCAAGGAHQFVLSDDNYTLTGVIGADTVLLEAYSKSI
jgi:hypothetical protein